MKSNYHRLIFISAIYLIASCKATFKRENQNEKVSIVCLKDSDTLYVKITNHTGKTIHIPKEYDGCYTLNNDTLYLETNPKIEFSTDYYYRYNDVFPFEFFTTRQIPDQKPDSTEKHVKQVFFYNQFRLQPIIKVSQDSSYIVTLHFDVPKYATIVKAVYYNEPFLDKDRIDRFDYSLKDFQKFDSLNAKYTIAPIFVRYR